jgi:hypothetical protein
VQKLEKPELVWLLQLFSQRAKTATAAIFCDTTHISRERHRCTAVFLLLPLPNNVQLALASNEQVVQKRDSTVLASSSMGNVTLSKIGIV